MKFTSLCWTNLTCFAGSPQILLADNPVFVFISIHIMLLNSMRLFLFLFLWRRNNLFLDKDQSWPKIWRYQRFFFIHSAILSLWEQYLGRVYIFLYAVTRWHLPCLSTSIYVVLFWFVFFQTVSTSLCILFKRIAGTLYYVSALSFRCSICTSMYYLYW